jgi:hypothetical protein
MERRGGPNVPASPFPINLKKLCSSWLEATNLKAAQRGSDPSRQPRGRHISHFLWRQLQQRVCTNLLV